MCAGSFRSCDHLLPLTCCYKSSGCKFAKLYGSCTWGGFSGVVARCSAACHRSETDSDLRESSNLKSCAWPPASTFMSLLVMGLPSKRSLNHSAVKVPVFGPLAVAAEPLTL